MDDFLYIIIGILWVVYSLYTNKQKQQKKRMMEEQRRQGGSPETAPRRSLLEELLDAEVKLPEPVAEAAEEQYIPEYTSTVEDRSAESIVPENESLEKIEEEVSASYFEQQYNLRARVDTVKPDRVHPAFVEEEAAIADIDEDFDLRKAVIYAEILNPRYI